MFKSALNYLSTTAEGLGVAAEGVANEATSQDHIVGSHVDVGGMGVRVERRIGEGGFAFVYAVTPSASNSKPLALKRLLAVDPEKRKLIVQEIAFLKSLKPCPHVLQFVTAANLTVGLSASKCEEFLVLTELCVASLYDYLVERSGAYPPITVARIFFQTLEAVGYMHRSIPPITHRDLKIENLLIDGEGNLKLCDFGSATTETFQPDDTWNMLKRTQMEEEMEKFTTPMYRAPEMLDTWNNSPVNIASDIWALGCLLFQLCFHKHPFEDGSKLAIVNANYNIPETDVTHTMFHDLIKQTLVVDPTWRPSCQQLQVHLGEVGVLNGWDLQGKIDFEVQKKQEDLIQTPSPSVDRAFPSQPSPVNSRPNVSATSSRSNISATSSSSTLPSSGSASQLMSSFRGGAGSVFKNIKESSKAVVSSLLAAKDMDFHLLTAKVAAMSYPADGIELTYKNQIEDIRQIMESRHADHYAIVNLCERKYASPRFPRGKVIDADWTSQVPPSVEKVLQTTMKVLEFLGYDKQNVVAIHCLDGRSNSALLFAAIMMVCRIFPKYRDALKLFEIKRCEPILSFGQRTVLKIIEKLVKTGPALQLTHQSVVINSVVLEPIPLFTKANDGVRPFVDIVSEGKLVASTLKDYNSLTLFTNYDGEVVLKTGGIRVPPGDIAVIVYHARQSSLGTFFAGGKMERVKICQVYFDPAHVSSTRNHVRFPTHELDGIADVERIPGDFSVSVNFVRKESKTVKFPYILPDKRKLDLVFQTKSEFQQAMEFVTGEAEVLEDIPQRPPREKKTPVQEHNADIKVNLPKPSSLIDIAGSQQVDMSNIATAQKPTSLLDITGESEASKPIVDNIFPEEKPVDNILLDFGVGTTNNIPASKPEAHFLVDSEPDLFATSSQSNAFSTGSNVGDLLGGFGAPTQKPRVPQPTGLNTQMHVNQSAPDLLSPASTDPVTTSSNLLGDFLAPTQVKVEPAKSQSQQMVDDMLEQLTVKNSQQSNPPQSTPTNKANYSSAFFQQPQAKTASTAPSKANFDDLLYPGFNPSNEGGNKTIGDMKKEVEKKHMDKDEAIIFEWTHGKSRNLRALLCSLDSVVWEGSRWTKCGMHQLVTFNDVKKMYRKACLAVHPDKQMGTDNEKLSKMIFTELNDGWSKFQEDEGQ